MSREEKLIKRLTLTYEFGGQVVTKSWVTENSFASPKKVIVINDTFSADNYMHLASQGVSFVWTGDYHNAKQLLQAVQRRIRKNTLASKLMDPESMSKEFYRHRQHQAHKALLLSRLMVKVEADFTISLPRAPDLRQAIHEAIPDAEGDFLISLRELQGYVGAYEWRKKGVVVKALGNKRIHPYYGVFSPIRGEYLDLVATGPLPPQIDVAFDIGTGTGVISAILANRGVKHIVATDIDDRAICCAQDNILNLGFEAQVIVKKTNLFPEGTADLIVCNPPWLPAKPTSAIERAVYDEDSKMITHFLKMVGAHLNKKGQAWLIISDLAEHLGLRKADDLKNWISQANLRVIDCMKIQPTHSKVTDEDDTLHLARAKETTMLWRITHCD